MTLTMIFLIYTNHQENIFKGHISFEKNEKNFDIFPLKFSAENLSITRNVYSLGLFQIISLLLSHELSCKKIAASSPEHRYKSNEKAVFVQSAQDETHL